MTMWQAVLLDFDDDVFQFLTFRKNNISKATSSKDGTVKTYTYKYNDNGYPTEMTITESGDVSVWKFEYTEVK